MARKLRIAVSVFFGLLTVALVVLWVRSYSTSDSISAQVIGRSVIVFTEFQRFEVMSFIANRSQWQWAMGSDEFRPGDAERLNHGPFYFNFGVSADGWGVGLQCLA